MPVLFSVIVPTYHRNEQLRECLAQLRASVQTISADTYEVIVTDDGKITTSQEMIQKEFPEVRWIAGPCKGPASNRNNGAAHARGRWLIFTDDDCIPTPGFIAGYSNGILSDTFAYEGKTVCDEVIISPLYVSPINLTGGCFWSCNIMIHKELFEKLGGFDVGFIQACNEDTDLRERLRYARYAIRFIPEAIVSHPPRLMKLGVQAGRLRETEVRMWYLTGNLSSSVISVKILRNIIWTGMDRVKRYPVQADTLRWLYFSFVEFLYVCLKLAKWNRKYRTVFDGSIPPYLYPY